MGPMPISAAIYGLRPMSLMETLFESVLIRLESELGEVIRNANQHNRIRDRNDTLSTKGRSPNLQI